MGSERPVRSVLISDVDNTLFDWVHIWHAAFSAMLNELLQLSGLDEDQLLPAIRAVHQHVGTSEYAFLIGDVPLLAKAAGETPVLDFYAPAIDAFRAARRRALNFYPGVGETLAELRSQGVLIICYTESLAYYSQYRFRKLGLDRLVDHLYSPPDHDLPEGLSREDIRFHAASHYALEHTDHRFTPVGEYKPNPDILRSILRDLGVAPDQAVYIGDNPHKDVWMAQQAGILDVYAAYGAVQDTEAYALLRKVSHWPDHDVIEERRRIEDGSVQPSLTLNRFDELLNHICFTAFGRNNHGGG